MNLENLKNSIDNLMNNSDKMIIVPHSNIDFDALGSSIGLSLIGKKYKKETHIISNDPAYILEHGCRLIIDEAESEYSFINKDNYTKIKDPNDMYIITDVSKKPRICINNLINDLDKTIIIDHHITDKDTLETPNLYIDLNASSASEIIVNLLTNHYNITIPNTVANYLLAGIYLDTNKLTKNVTPSTMNLVGKLLEFGGNINDVMEYFTEDFMSDRRVQDLVNQAQMITMSIAIIRANEENTYTREELAKAADYMLKYKVDAAFAIGKVSSNTISISARSKDKVDVNDVMEIFNGGGTKNSAAAKLKNENIDECSKKLVKKLMPSCYIDNV